MNEFREILGKFLPLETSLSEGLFVSEKKEEKILKVGRKYLLGREPKESKEKAKIEKEFLSSNYSPIFLKTKDLKDLNNLSRKHLLFEFQMSGSEAYFKIEKILGRNKQVVVYYKGVKDLGGKRIKPLEPLLAQEGEKFEVVNLVVLLPASKDKVLKIEFESPQTGSGEKYFLAAGFSLSKNDMSIFDRGLEKIKDEELPSFPFPK